MLPLSHKQVLTGEEVLSGQEAIWSQAAVDLAAEDNGDDDAVDGGYFTKNDGDEVLCGDPRSTNAGSQDGGASDVDSPRRAGDG